jgi:1-acyl-sn-glycerol-3-phosphate acyltransferase
LRFNDRRGYVRLALERGVKVVPLATLGSHHSYTMLPGGEALACALDLHRRLRTHCLPLPLGGLAAILAIVLAAAGVLWWPIAAMVALLGLVPWPVRVTSELLEPIDVVGETAHLADFEERVEHAHELVHGRLQRAVATMDHEPQLTPR